MARCSPAALAAAAAACALALQGCGGGGGPSPAPAPGPATTVTTTTTVYRAPGQCSDRQRRAGCAYGFCNRTEGGGGCECLANWEATGYGCRQPQEPRRITFYMYRAQDDRNFTWANDDLASLSGAMWYLHNEVVIQSCPRHYLITRLLRLKVTVFNPAAMYNVRKSLFGPFAIFDSGTCHGCQEEIFDHYGYVVGCSIAGASDNYTWGGYKPVWYSLPGECPSKDFATKTPQCKKEQPGGMCDDPNGDRTCTWNYTEAGEVRLDELYGPGFDYKDYCARLGGQNIPGEYDRATDRGRLGIGFWDDKGSAGKNARRVEAIREIFRAKYPDMPDLPEPWCDWGAPPPSAAREALTAVVV